MATKFPDRLGTRRQFWQLFFGLQAGILVVWLLFGRGGGHGWFVWSGVLLGLMFLVTYAFSLRKWSVKLRWIRMLGATGTGDLQLLFQRTRELERRVAREELTDEDEILSAANRILIETGMAGVREAVMEHTQVSRGTRTKAELHIKRKERFGRLNVWLEVHVAVGMVACFGALFHADWVIRSTLGMTLAVLSGIVLFTGLIGWWLTQSAPRMLVEQKLGMPIEVVGPMAEHLLRCSEGLKALMDPQEQERIAPLLEGPYRPDRVAEFLARGDSGKHARDVLVLAGTGHRLLHSAAPSYRIMFFLRVWKWIHIPAALLLLFFILIHIWAVWYY